MAQSNAILDRNMVPCWWK